MARTDDSWEVGIDGTYLQTISPVGYNILINGSNKYLNFNSVVGSSGYGIRDNGGTMEFKNSGGVWAGLGSGGGTPGGLTTQVQFNDAGSFAGDSTFTFDKTTKVFRAQQIISTGLISTQSGFTLEETGAGTDVIAIQAPASISGGITLTLPDAYAAVTGYVLSSTTAGVLSWVAQPSLTGYVPYTGATGDVNLGVHALITTTIHTLDANSDTNLNIVAGSALSGDNNGGAVYVGSGSGSGANNGGGLTFETGSGGDTGNGGTFNMTAGSGGATIGDGGSFSMIAGSAQAGDGNGGNFSLEAGMADGTGANGSFQLVAAGGSLVINDDGVSLSTGQNINLNATNYVLIPDAYVGIGTDTPTYALEVLVTDAPSGIAAGLGHIIASTPANQTYGLYGNNSLQSGITSGQNVNGVGGEAYSSGTINNDAFLVGLYGYAQVDAGTTANAAALVAYPVTVNAGTVTNAFGLYVFDQTGGTNNYNIWSGPALSDMSATVQADWTGYLSGNVFMSNTPRPYSANVFITENNVGGGASTGFYSYGTGNGTNVYNFEIVSYGVPANGDTIIEATGIYAAGSNRGAGTVTDIKAIRVGAATNSGGGTVTNNYGIIIENQTTASNNWAIKTGLGLVQLGDELIVAASTTSRASLNIPVGSAPTSPVDGDVWREDNTNTGLKIRVNGVSKTITLS